MRQAKQGCFSNFSTRPFAEQVVGTLVLFAQLGIFLKNYKICNIKARFSLCLQALTTHCIGSSTSNCYFRSRAYEASVRFAISLKKRNTYGRIADKFVNIGNNQ
ncbi:hypothetical protein T4B_3422 [Trichinella pseudospiralis]|uniref:Uncharacterized protein n=1 Tax=Trichinella pseudospiralis TaxID=6337 RepID=A0A0V1IZN3_TRIPS|nr:hypothetical protein T4B_3422 [Trichinella pseudospiralis]KRZ37945.1 hypothetical protein T4C_1757 [Trichinella pseudospiralis]